MATIIVATISLFNTALVITRININVNNIEPSQPITPPDQPHPVSDNAL